MLMSRTTTYDNDPISDCEGVTVISVDCCGALVDTYTIDTTTDEGVTYCGTGEARGRCAHRQDVI